VWPEADDHNPLILTTSCRRLKSDILLRTKGKLERIGHIWAFASRLHYCSPLTGNKYDYRKVLRLPAGIYQPSDDHHLALIDATNRVNGACDSSGRMQAGRNRCFDQVRSISNALACPPLDVESIIVGCG